MVLKYKDIHAFDNYKTMKILFTVCTELVRSPYIEHAASGLSNPTRLEGGGGGGARFIQAQDQQVLLHLV